MDVIIIDGAERAAKERFWTEAFLSALSGSACSQVNVGSYSGLGYKRDEIVAEAKKIADLATAAWCEKMRYKP